MLGTTSTARTATTLAGAALVSILALLCVGCSTSPPRVPAGPLRADTNSPAILRHPVTGIRDSEPHFKRDDVVRLVSLAMERRGYAALGEMMPEMLFERTITVHRGDKSWAYPTRIRAIFDADREGRFSGVSITSEARNDPIAYVPNRYDESLYNDSNPYFVGIRDLMLSFDDAAQVLFGATPTGLSSVEMPELRAGHAVAIPNHQIHSTLMGIGTGPNLSVIRCTEGPEAPEVLALIRARLLEAGFVIADEGTRDIVAIDPAPGQAWPAAVYRITMCTMTGDSDLTYISAATSAICTKSGADRLDEVFRVLNEVFDTLRPTDFNDC